MVSRNRNNEAALAQVGLFYHRKEGRKEGRKKESSIIPINCFQKKKLLG
jgi:hypothetical protein